MLDEASLASLRLQVLGGAFLLGALLGWIAQRSHFCVMGALSDIVAMQDWMRARMWALAAAVAMLGFALLGQAGWVQAGQTLYGGTRLLWASNLFGGLLFGVGMVMASGCGAKTLVRVGTGNLKALVVLIVMGLSAFMTMRGLTAVWRNASVDQWAVALSGPQDLPSLLGLSPWLLVLPLAGTALAFAWPSRRNAGLWFGGLGVGLLVIGTWVWTAHIAYLPEHPQTLEAAWIATSFNRPEAFSFVAPAAGLLDWLLFYSDASKQLGFGVVSLLGVVVGAAVSALQRREFHWEGFRQTEDLANHLIGAVLMGIGGVTALGCTFGQGLSGVSTLSLGSFVAVAGIVIGGLLALCGQLWRAQRA